MAENDFQNVDDPINADLQKALMAAFGDEAVNWENIAESQEALPGAPEAKPSADSNAITDPSSALEELLKKVSSAVDDGVTPDMLLGGNTPTGERQQDDDDDDEATNVGPRHVVFEIGDQLFGLPLSGVQEIDRCGDVTALPRTPAWLRGVTNLRGQILSVTDFRNLLNLNSDRVALGEKIIVVNSPSHNASTAVVVDRVLGIRNLSSDSGPLAGLSDRVATFADGLSVTDEATTVLIDPDLLLGCDELQAFARK